MPALKGKCVLVKTVIRFAYDVIRFKETNAYHLFVL